MTSHPDIAELSLLGPKSQLRFYGTSQPCRKINQYRMGLTIYFSAVAYSDDMDRFFGRVYLIDDAVIISLSERISTLFVSFKRFSLVRAVNERVNGIYETRQELRI